MRARESNDLSHWIKFFLVAVRETADKGTKKFHAILALRTECEALADTLGRRAPNARRLLEFLYKEPVCTVPSAARNLDMAPQTVRTLMHEFERLGILHERTGFQRNQVYALDRYIDAFREEDL